MEVEKFSDLRGGLVRKGSMFLKGGSRTLVHPIHIGGIVSKCLIMSQNKHRGYMHEASNRFYHIIYEIPAM